MKVNVRFLDWVIFQIPEGGTMQRLAASTTWFDMLYGDSGYNNAKNWFLTNATSPGNTLNELQFSHLLARLTDFNEFESLDIFDIFDKDETGYIGFEEFFLLIALLAARESGQCTKFLYKHGRAMFDLIASSSSTSYTGTSILITFERFSKFGYTLGMSETELITMLRDFEVNLFDMVDVDRFLLYYFMILDAFDRRKNPITEDFHNSTTTPPMINTGSSDDSSKSGDESRRGGCCVIL